MSATKENQRDSGEEDRKLEGGVLRQDPAPPAPKASGLHPAVYIGYVYPSESLARTSIDRAPRHVCGAVDGGAGVGDDALHTVDHLGTTILTD